MTAPQVHTLEYGIAPPAYRLPDATRLGRVRLRVADVDRSSGYYQTVTGLSLLERKDGVPSLGPAGTNDVIVELHGHPGARPVTRRGQIGLYHFAILFPNRAALGRFI